MTPPPDSPTAVPPDVGWVLPGNHGSPAEALARIGLLCQSFPDLFTALWTVMATHQGLPRELLALAVLQQRPDVADLGKEGLTALMVAIANGGRQGFDAVLRSRRKSERKANAFSWVRE